MHPDPPPQVGTRFVLSALALLYKSSAPYLSPAYASACQHSAGGDLVVTVSFSANTVYGGLHLQYAECPTAQGVPSSYCSW